MALSEFTIRSSDFVWQDKNSKSLSFFSKESSVFCSAKIITELKALSAKNEDANVRICLHSSPEDSLQNMVLLAKMGVYYQPHLHQHKSESYHIIEGGLAYFEFDAIGNIVDMVELGTGDILRVGKKTIHLTLPLSDPTIFHETAVGPFDATRNMTIPEWAPGPESHNAVRSFLERIITAMPQFLGNSSAKNKLLKTYNILPTSLGKF